MNRPIFNREGKFTKETTRVIIQSPYRMIRTHVSGDNRSSPATSHYSVSLEKASLAVEQPARQNIDRSHFWISVLAVSQARCACATINIDGPPIRELGSKPAGELVRRNQRTRTQFKQVRCLGTRRVPIGTRTWIVVSGGFARALRSAQQSHRSRRVAFSNVVA